MTTDAVGDETQDDPLQAGAVFGRYVIARRIGKGGIGAVYEATHADLQKRVALKTLHPEYARDPQVRARFLQEGKAASRLRHPHVVDVSDFGVQDGNAFLVMEYLEGEGLDAVLAREGALSVERIAELLLPICSAVSAAHREGIVHRDLKPENIFLARNALGQTLPKVLDFGISKLDDPGSNFVKTGTAALLGTPYYMSPEQAQGARGVDARSDQYALGVILYECTTGQKPFDADALYVLLKNIVEGACAPPRQLVPTLPERFERMVLRAMNVAPEGRFPSVDDLARELVSFAAAPARSTWEPLLSIDASARPSSPSSTPSAPPDASSNTLNASAREIPVARRDNAHGLRAWVLVGVALVALAALVGVARVRSNTARPTASTHQPDAPVVTPVAPVAEPAPIAERPTPPPPARVDTTPAVPAPTPVEPPPRSVRARVRPTQTATATGRALAAPQRPSTPAPQRGANGASIEE